MVAERVISGQIVEYNSNVELDERVFNQENYEKYMRGVFKTLISGFLDLRYNDSIRGDGIADTQGTLVRKSLTKEDLDGYNTSSYVRFDQESDTSEFRKKYGIPASFSETDIADDIENGKDSLENYTGY